MKLKIKRAYEEADDSDGKRVLIDRLWPRGVSRETAQIDLWMREIAPSTELRKWFGHDPAKWEAFQSRYNDELDSNPELVDTIRTMAMAGQVTLIYAAKDEEHNDAVVLLNYLKKS